MNFTILPSVCEIEKNDFHDGCAAGFGALIESGFFSNLTLDSTDDNSLKIEADPDIAGIGIFITFAFGFFSSLIVAILVHLCESLEKDAKRDPERGKWTKRIHNALDKILISWSDQQIVLGLATGIATTIHWSLFSSYHLNIIKNWLLFCTITHANALLVHCDYFTKKHRAANVIRAILLVVHIGLTMNIVILKDHKSWSPNISDRTPLQIFPPNCFAANDTRPVESMKAEELFKGGIDGRVLLWVALAFVTIGAISLLRHSGLSSGQRSKSSRRVWWWVRTGLLLANAIVGILATISTSNIRKWMFDEGLLEDCSEDSWSYGQFVPIVMVFLVLFGAAEALLDDLADSDAPNNGSIEMAENQLLGYGNDNRAQGY
ncbi:hypothetical protein QBC41DRAFT_304022 [Cercophora samala]|uniref:Uncharacterized protein n=1 Tax=Cercophora samala TaxID=330535 RepID=A0AA39ZCD1_9PEZI|nr:hypothetical protein QBC41DRAFT_304022 [Cercophora samala]